MECENIRTDLSASVFSSVLAPTDRSAKRSDTVGQSPSAEIGVPNMPSLKVKKLRRLPQEKVLIKL
jgi:hypothetical protein